MPDPVIAAIHARRSVGRVLPDPLPRELVSELLEAAVTAPNHHLTGPWRFVVLTGGARRALGEVHAAAAMRENPDLPEAAREKEAGRLERAPVVIACCVIAGDDPVTAREDRDAVAAAVQNLLLAAQAKGLGAMWRSGAMVDEPEVRDDLGLRPQDAVLGFVYLGRPTGDPAPPRAARAGLEGAVVWREG